MKFSLHIEGDTTEPEGARLFALFAGASTGALNTAAPAAEPAPAAPKPARAAKAKDAPAEAAPAVDPFASPATEASTGQATAADPGPASGQTATTAASPSDGGEITYDALKDLMTELLGKTSAATAQQTVKDAANGKGSLSALDKTEYPAVHAALLAKLGR